LKEAGYEVGEKTLRDIIREAESKKTRRRSGRSSATEKATSSHIESQDNVKVPSAQ
ncbi:molybdopterin-guanine dinucleotide biosynthesis protein MobC, partial [Salmonella enterica subsp. enterica]|nr:molybdopterin-guanine dinucleotide biosynthesis protein MobC [Salmonella enterica subsp. enterica]